MINVTLSLQTVGRDDIFYCTFGPSPGVRITLTRPPREVIRAENTYVADRTLYRVKTRVHNTSTRAAVKALRVRDAAPVPLPGGALDKQVGVTVRKPVALQELVEKAEPGKKPQSRDVEVKDASEGTHVQVHWDKETGAKEGRYEWLVDLGPGETVQLEAEYEVSAAAHVQWYLRED